MAKEVDLSSREWCDLVFEGKNKDFGAYVIRTESPKRHNMAVLWTLIGAVAVALLAFGLVKANQYLEEQRRLAGEQDQTEVLIDMSQEAEEPEPEQERLEQPKPEVLPEEVLQSVKVTELAIVEDEKVKKEDEIKTIDELKETETAFGQKDNKEGTEDRNVTKTLKDEVVVEKKEPEKPKEAAPEKVFTSVEQMPQFPGGDAALMKYLSSHINYPPMAAENNVQGKVILQFVVEKDGKVGEVKVARSVDKDLDKEAIRVVKSLPKFTPGRQNGQAVRVWYTLPVTFKLQGTN
jgi:protein TonB